MAGGSVQSCNSCLNYKRLEEAENQGNASSASHDFQKDVDAVKEAIVQGVDGNDAVQALAYLVQSYGTLDAISTFSAIVRARPETARGVKEITVPEMADVAVNFKVSFENVGRMPSLSNKLVREVAEVAREKSDLFAAMIDAIRSQKCSFEEIVQFGKTAVKFGDYLGTFKSQLPNKVSTNVESKGWVAA